MSNEQTELVFKDLVTEVAIITKRRKKPAKSKNKDYDLIEFNRVLNTEPPLKLIKTNKEYKNKYIPIQVVEQMLLAIYGAYEIVIPFAPTLMEGQVITVVNIIVHHPILKTTLTYSGLSTVPLIAAESLNMKWNHRNIPGGKGFAILNASKEIGQIFRAEKDDYSDIMRDYFEKKAEVTEEDKANGILKNRMLKMINTSKTIAQLQKRAGDNDFKDKDLKEAYMKKKLELNQPKNK
jgi:hypothetical protein